MSAATAKSLAARKLKRQKLFIVVGSVALLGILGFQMPKLLGRGHETAATVPTAPATVSGSGSGSASPGAAGELPDTDRLVVERSSDQLLSFGLFKSKDPFVQQLALKAAVPAQSPPPAPAATKTTSSPRPSGQIGVGLTPVTTDASTPQPPSSPPANTATPPTATGTSSTTTPAAPATAPTSVLISTNDVCETVALKGTFPTGEDIFRIVSIARNGKSVEIAVVGGSYDSGQPAAILKLGSKLTLVNTADGTRYVISLESKCDPAQQARSSGATPVPTSPVSTTPAPQTPVTPPTATTTTPIVTDALDTTTTPFG